MLLYDNDSIEKMMDPIQFKLESMKQSIERKSKAMDNIFLTMGISKDACMIYDYYRQEILLLLDKIINLKNGQEMKDAMEHIMHPLDECFPKIKEAASTDRGPKPFHLGTALHDMVDWLSPERFHVMWRKWWEMRLARIGHTVESFLGEKGGYFGLNQEQRAELKVKRMARRRELTDKAAWHDTFVGETHLFEHMNDWRRQDKHLADWECFQRAKSIARRDQDYRSFSKSLAMQYEKIILADINWAELARKRELQNDGEQTDNLTNLQRRRGRLHRCRRHGKHRTPERLRGRS